MHSTPLFCAIVNVRFINGPEWRCTMPEDELADIDNLDVQTLRAIERGCVEDEERNHDDDGQFLTGFPEGFDLGM